MDYGKPQSEILYKIKKKHRTSARGIRSKTRLTFILLYPIISSNGRNKY